MRIGTREREDAIQHLGEHFAEGRLLTEEYEHRAGAAAAAMTRRDLAELFRDLPTPHPACLAPPPAVPPPQPVVPIFASPPAHTDQVSDRNRLAAGVLQIVLPFGVGRFYTGHTGLALAQLFTAVIFIGVLWSWIDGIILLAQGGTDNYGRPLRF